jgi:hypothetical protein
MTGGMTGTTHRQRHVTCLWVAWIVLVIVRWRPVIGLGILGLDRWSIVRGLRRIECTGVPQCFFLGLGIALRRTGVTNVPAFTERSSVE